MAFDEEMHFRQDSAPLLLRRGATDASAVALAPGPAARLLVLHLPMKSARARSQAAGYAAEPVLGEPVEAVHVAVGPPVGEDRYLCAAASHACMTAWIESLDRDGDGGADLVPELCALSRPAPAAWTVQRDGARMLVRGAEGDGFVCSETIFATLKEVLEIGEPETAHTRAELDAPVSLRTGPYAVRRGAPKTALRAGALIAGVTALAAFGLLWVEIAALNAVHADRLDTARARLETLYGARYSPALAADPVPALERLAPGAGGERSPGLSALLGAAGAALAQSGGAVSVLALDYRGEALTLSVEADDLAALQALQAALRDTGTALEPGPVSQTGGRAEMDLALRLGDAS